MKPTATTVHSTALQLADLCAAKRRAYGDSVPRAAQMLALLYPEGIAPHQYLAALFAARDFEKRCRLAHQGAHTNDPAGEDPRLDIAGYALLAYHLEVQRTREKEIGEPCASVKEDAATPSTATPGSAAKGAAAPTLPSGVETLVWLALQRASASSASTSEPGSTSTDSAPAPAAPTPASAASASAGGRRRSSWHHYAAAVAVLFIGLGWFFTGPDSHQPPTIWSMLRFFGFLCASLWLLLRYTEEEAQPLDAPNGIVPVRCDRCGCSTPRTFLYGCNGTRCSVIRRIVGYRKETT